MFRKLVKTGEIEIEGRNYVVRYFEQRTARGGRPSSLATLRTPIATSPTCLIRRSR